MKILLLNQTFHPDVASTAQHLKDFALGLAERGHDVRVISSRRAYDSPTLLFPARESWRGIEIYRIRSSGFGKSAKWKRAVDFGTFLLSCLWRLLTVPRPDVVVALTSPPLISFIGACYARLRGARFVYWVMDLNPDEAVAAGWLRPDSMVTRLLDALSRFSFHHASRVIALDRFMAARIGAKPPSPHAPPRNREPATGNTACSENLEQRTENSMPWDPRIQVIAPWSHDDVIRFDAAGREQFRREHGLTDKFVVMYSGNHSPCHSLTTLVEAARALAEEPRYMFVFVGGGSEWPKVREFAKKHSLENVLCLPYQPLDQLAGSLSAADLHVVVMGDAFVGTVHPCKVYNILSVGAPVLYIGPAESHVTEIFQSLKAEGSRLNKGGARGIGHGADEERLAAIETWYEARHGDVTQVVEHVRGAAAVGRRGDEAIYSAVSSEFSKERLLPRQIKVIESLG